MCVDTKDAPHKLAYRFLQNTGSVHDEANSIFSTVYL